MVKALFQNKRLVVIALINLLIAVGLLSTAVSPLSHPFVWISLLVVFHAVLVLNAMSANQRLKAENSTWRSAAEKRLTDAAAQLSETKAENELLKEEIKKKEQAIENANLRTSHLREELECANKECIKLCEQNNRQRHSLEYMTRRLAAFTNILFKEPSPASFTGADLKSLRFEILRIAVIGFEGLGKFTWQYLNGVNPRMYRDFVHVSLGERVMNPKKSWASDMILAAHQDQVADKSAA